MIKARKIFNFRPLFYAFLAMMLAICVARDVFAGSAKHIVFAVIVLVVFLLYGLFKRRWAALVLVFCAFGFGLGWHFLGLATFVGKQFTGEVQVVGRISDDLDVSPYGNSVTAVLKDVKIDGQSTRNIYLTIKAGSSNNSQADALSKVQPGQVVTFVSQVQQAKLFELGQFQSFYYRANAPYVATVNVGDVVVQGTHLKFDEKVRLGVKDLLFSNMGEENGAVAYAVLFGDKSDISDQTLAAYKTAGVVHLLTVSGLHVSFLVLLLGFVLKKLRVRGVWNFLTCALLLLLYAYLCGFSPSVVRASIMGLVLLGTQISGRWYDALSAVGLSGLLILLVSPLSAMDIGFEMSYFCVLGIFVLSPLFTKFFRKFLPKVVAESFAISVAVQIGILPFLAQIFSGLNFLTFFVNLIVIPIFAVLYPLLFVSTILCAAMPFLGFLLKFCGFGFVAIEEIAAFFGETKLIFALKRFDIFFVAACALLCFLLCKFFMSKKKMKILASVGALCVATFLLAGVPIFVQKSSVVCAYNGSASMLVFTNSQKQSLIVDFAGKTFSQSVLDELNIKTVENAVVLQDATLDIESARFVGVKNIVRSDGGEGYAEEILVQPNQAVLCGGFALNFKYHYSTLVGVEISFDGQDVFVIRDVSLRETQLATAADKEYDLVVLGKHTEYASYFNARNISGYNSDEKISASVEKFGNFCYNLNNFSCKSID